MASDSQLGDTLLGDCHCSEVQAEKKKINDLIALTSVEIDLNTKFSDLFGFNVPLLSRALNPGVCKLGHEGLNTKSQRVSFPEGTSLRLSSSLPQAVLGSR